MAKKQPKKPTAEAAAPKRNRTTYNATAGPKTLDNLAWIADRLGLPNRSVVIDFIAAETRRRLEKESGA